MPMSNHEPEFQAKSLWGELIIKIYFILLFIIIRILFYPFN